MVPATWTPGWEVSSDASQFLFLAGAAAAGTAYARSTVAVALLVPVKAFPLAKSRLANVLVPPGRAALARAMATSVLRAGGALPKAVVCDDERVARWAASQGALVIWKPGRGLNAAVTEAVEDLGARGFQRVVVAHGDLPLARSFDEVADFDGVTLVPDRRHLGTNVLCLPTGTSFTFGYGVDSFAFHTEQATLAGLDVRVLTDADLGLDIDTADDLDELRGRPTSLAQHQR